MASIAPGWYLGEGWALTPETAGVATEDRRGLGLGAHRAGFGAARTGDGDDRRPELRRRVPAASQVSDRRPAHRQLSVPPGFFFDSCRCRRVPLAGAGGTRTALGGRDAGHGWSSSSSMRRPPEASSGSATAGTRWNTTPPPAVVAMDQRAGRCIRARAGHRALDIGCTSKVRRDSFSRPTHVSVRVGERAIGRWTVRQPFRVESPIAATPARRRS